MIVYDVKCPDGHRFEAWFPDSAGFEKQRKAGTVACPDCGSTEVEKALMAPNVAAKKGNQPEAGSTKAKQALMMMSKFREMVEKHCDYVGPDFAEEARKIHYSEVDQHNIYGEATAEDSQSLRDDGIEFAELPWVRRTDA